MYQFNGTIIEKQKSMKILENLRERYVDENYPQKLLLINHLKSIEKVISIEELRNIKLPESENIFLYHERLKTLYLTNFEDICMYIEQLEPWQDVDCIVFEEKLDWLLGITHDESILLIGI